jgi:hypothetical protein
MKKLLYLVAFTAASGSILGQGEKAETGLEHKVARNLAKVISEFANKTIVIPSELAQDDLRLEASFFKLCADKLRLIVSAHGSVLHGAPEMSRFTVELFKSAADRLDGLAATFNHLQVPRLGVKTPGSEMLKMLHLKARGATLASEILSALVKQTDNPEAQKALQSLSTNQDKKASFIRAALRETAPLKIEEQHVVL